ncbi:hybrid sensor histidine kinase/response regulator [Elioraea tepidiphila]|uniref:hybrid sensor histidine kinase/response regulator n=1 Tax=Elioraea tepidiphila TaxID=457934 RepID=UPI000361EAFE|nr:PAS-domain containing protein [Elioraea tepidiphila]
MAEHDVSAASALPEMNETLFRSVLDRTLARIAFLDRDRIHRYVNPEYASFIGLPIEAILGRSVAEVLGAAAAAQLGPLGRRALAGETVRWLGWLSYPGERRRYVERVYHPVPGPDGTICGYFTIVRDFTDLKRREEELARRTAQLEAILGHIAEGVNIVDAEGRVVLANEGFLRMYGYPTELGVPGTPLAAFVRYRLNQGAYYAHENPAEDREALVESRVAALMSAGNETVEEQRPDGRTFEVRRRRLPDGGLLSTYTDVTAVREAEREVRAQREAVRQSERLSALGSLLAGVAHELNNPLSIVVAHATLLEDMAGSDPALVARTQKIRSAADRCARIVQTFLGLARRRPPERKPLRIVEVVEAAFDLVGYTLRSAGVTITRDLPADLPPISADADQLVQVMINLLTNAHQALLTRAHPRLLAISGHAREDGGIVLTVADNGPGVPPEVRERVFDPFFTTKPEGVGTGVGLSLCRSIVTAHGGVIALAETPGGGATIRIVLPPGPRAPEAASDQTERPALVARRLRSALVVDDEPEVGAVLAEILRTDGMLVDTASDGAGAQAMLAERAVDLIVTDLRMPGVDGMALHRWLVETRPELARRVVFVTGDRITTAIDIALRETGRPVLAKPFTPADVRRVVREVVDEG